MMTPLNIKIQDHRVIRLTYIKRVVERVCLLLCLGFFICTYTEGFCQSYLNKEAVDLCRLALEENISTIDMESSPFFYQDKIAYVTSNYDGLADNANGYFFDLAYARHSDINGLVEKDDKWDTSINSKDHEGAGWYDLMTHTLYFTRATTGMRRVKGIVKDTVYLNIYASKLSETNKRPRLLGINIEGKNTCHPTLNNNGTKMIFSSNREGSKGKMDLFVSYKNDNAWESVASLGEAINTEYNEIFPTLFSDTILIFSSDRPGGFGQLDLYISILRDGSWSSPELMPRPFNSGFDDLGMILHDSARAGYLSSNRPGGKGKDDIYRFETTMPLIGTIDAEMSSVYVHILDKLTFQPITHAHVGLSELAMSDADFLNNDFELVSTQNSNQVLIMVKPKDIRPSVEYSTDEEGLVIAEAKRKSKYIITITAEGYQPYSFLYSAVQYGDDFDIVLSPDDTQISFNADTLTIENTPIVETPENMSKDINEKLTSGDVLVFNNIMYAYNSAQLDTAAVDELDALAVYMLDNKDIKVRLESHTDSRGDDRYNLKLSKLRANAAKQYLVQKGVNPSHIFTVGHGEKNIKNKCINGALCTESEHLENRRTEVFLIK